jgi:phospholipid/cholesterol/gamma-HCH transport system substrate-binding protein
MIGKADSLSDGLQTLLTNVNNILDEDLDRSLKGSLSNVESLTGEFRVTLQQERSRINRTLANLDSLLITAQNISSSERDKISATMANMEKASARLDEMITEFQGATTSLTAIMQKVERGEGTLGKLVNDDKLYTDMNRLMVNLDGLVVDLKENPKRYLNVSIF